MDPLASRAMEALLAAPELRSRRVHGVWLFGSRARGDARLDSDVDLAVLCEPALGLARAALSERVAEAVGVEVDVVDLASANGTLRWKVATEGKLLHEGDCAQLHAFLRKARFDAEDEQHRNRIVVQTQTGAPVWRRFP